MYIYNKYREASAPSMDMFRISMWIYVSIPTISHGGGTGVAVVHEIGLTTGEQEELLAQSGATFQSP